MADSDSRRSKASGRRAPASGGLRLQVEVVSPGGLHVPGLGNWLRSVAPARARGGVTVAIVPDTRVQALNRRFRKKDTPTDVLSFPADERGYLGDVVIAAGVARRQARDAGHSLQTELRVLALHGLLHLLGYDHEVDGGRMARLERRLRSKGGLREGLIERQGPGR
jgi:probable rRNA maturation factor